MVDDENDQISNGDERNDACVLEGVQSSQETKRYDDEHECRDPEVSVDQEGNLTRVLIETPDDSWHQVANDDQIGDSDSEAFYGDRGIKYNGGIGVSELRERKEGRAAPIEISGAPSLKVKPERRGNPRPHYYKGSQQHPHL